MVTGVYIERRGPIPLDGINKITETMCGIESIAAQISRNVQTTSSTVAPPRISIPTDVDNKITHASSSMRSSRRGGARWKGTTPSKGRSQ